MLVVKDIVVGLLQTHCYLCYHGETKEGFLVDPGYAAERILATVRETGVTVQGILLTHGHFDHTMALTEVRDALSAPVFAGKDEAELCLNPEMNLSGRYSHEPVSFSLDRPLSDGETFEIAGFSVKVIATPGHTRGSVCYYMEDEKTLISGDTLFCETYGITCHPTGSQAEVIASVEHLLTTLPAEVTVYPGHGEPTTVGHEQDCNPARAEYRMMKGMS